MHKCVWQHLCIMLAGWFVDSLIGLLGWPVGPRRFLSECAVYGSRLVGTSKINIYCFTLTRRNI